MGAIVGAANCAVAAAAGGAFTVTKTGGADGVSDASAVSTAAIAGDFVLRVKPLGPGLFFAGVSAVPAATIDESGINRALQFSAGLCRAVESGAFRPGSFALATYAWIRRSGGTIQYLTGPVLATAAVRRTVADAGAPFFFDSALAAAGVGFEVKFDVPAAFAPRRPGRRGLTLGLSL
ncbi:MAG: hypothetical protein JO013_05580 [Alphaproteobacteria bacterium]|nr:hypothetical protein [Alphaproteobacteria bacterium]